MALDSEIADAFSLDGRVAVITGGASGLGQEAARLFATAGARVVLADIDPAGLEATAAKVCEAGGEAVIQPTDVADRDAVETLAPPETLRTSEPSTDTTPAPPAFETEVVCLATDPTSMFVYWEIRPLVFARARWRDPRGQLVLRVVVVRASIDAEAPAVVDDERDLPIDGLTGERFVRRLQDAVGRRVAVVVVLVGPVLERHPAAIAGGHQRLGQFGAGACGRLRGQLAGGQGRGHGDGSARRRQGVANVGRGSLQRR